MADLEGGQLNSYNRASAFAVNAAIRNCQLDFLGLFKERRLLGGGQDGIGSSRRDLDLARELNNVKIVAFFEKKQ